MALPSIQNTQASAPSPMEQTTAKTDNKYIPDGPIPGANFTSDTKNYPWHREPEITELDKGIEASMKQLSSRKGAFGLLNSLQAGVTVVQATSMFLMSGIGKGLWTPDFALLLAGPVAKMMDIMAKDSGIKYVMGLEELPEKTIAYFQAQANIKNVTGRDVDAAVEGLKASEEVTNNIPQDTPTKGFMNKPTSIEQSAEEGMPSLAGSQVKDPLL